jgi:hypothetical protein
MKILIWVKEENLEKMKNWLWQKDHSILNKPPLWFTFNPGADYLTLLIDYDAYIALKDANEAEYTGDE